MKQLILLVGHSDTCLMPLCAAVLNSMLKKKKMTHIRVVSCGFFALNGHPIDPLMVTAAGEMGLDLSRTRARYIDHSLTEQATTILPMDEMIRRGLREWLLREEGKLGRPMKLTTPKGADLQSYREAREQVLAYCNRLMRKLTDQARREEKEITLRPLVPQDTDGVFELETLCFSHPWTKENIRSEMDKPNCCFVGAFYRDQLVGYGSLDLVCDEGNINNIGVHPDYRRRGIASRLVQGLEQHCVDRSARRITLEVRSKNTTAISLYQKYGFVQVGRRKGFYRDPVDDALIMAKEL